MVSKQSMKQLCVLQRAIMSQPMDDKTVRRIVKCFLRRNIKCFLQRNMKCFLSANQPTLADKTKDDDFLCTSDTILRFGDAEYLGENPETNIIFRWSWSCPPMLWGLWSVFSDMWWLPVPELSGRDGDVQILDEFRETNIIFWCRFGRIQVIMFRSCWKYHLPLKSVRLQCVSVRSVLWREVRNSFAAS